MRIQLWSIYYDPVPTGIGPVSTIFARTMRDRGHEVDVVTAHPHYPAPEWGTSRRPYREERDGISVLRLPLAVGRGTAARRLLQELSFAASQAIAIPALGSPDVVVAVSPSFPALAPAIANSAVRRRPWILWLQDILPEGAVSTELVRPGRVLAAAQRLEHAAYRSADRVVVISESFAHNLRAKGVPAAKIARIYNPSTRQPSTPVAPSPGPTHGAPRILSMGNIGLSQGLTEYVRWFQESTELERLGAHLVIAGHGVAADEVRAAIRSDRVEMLGLVSDGRLEEELRRATLGVVTQRSGLREFNLPSKLMNFMAYGIPVVAAVEPESEVARIVESSGAGWVTESARPERFPERIAEALADRAGRESRGEAAAAYAGRYFSPHGMAERFEELLTEVVDLPSPRRGVGRELTR
ncbi:MAG: glycosyltransferase family 4 protein [Thermoleophilaceae bacterium]|nr:glycosyltransferase family 4 protein [Thermoleophilaceae bacterium]